MISPLGLWFRTFVFLVFCLVVLQLAEPDGASAFSFQGLGLLATLLILHVLCITGWAQQMDEEERE